MGSAMWWDFLGRSKKLNRSGKRREMFSGALPLELFRPDWQQWATKWPSGGPNEVAQCSLLERCPAIGEGLLKEASGLGTQEQVQGLFMQLLSKWVNVNCPLQGILVWYLPNVLESRFVFYWCNLPLQNKPTGVFFFSSFVISTRACGGHKITSATSWLKQLVVLFVKVQFSFWGKSIQLNI